MTRFLLLLALVAGSATAQTARTDSRDGPLRDGPLRVTSLDSPMLLAADGAEVWVAAGTYSVARLDAPMRLVADGGRVRLTGLAGPVLAAAPTRASATAAETALDAAFPNPFSRTATVPLTLAQAAEVDVRVVDVLGREVARLAQGARDAGTYPLTLAADALANGVYVVVAEIRPASGDTVRFTQRITLAR